MKAAQALNEGTVRLGQLGFTEHAHLLTKATELREMAGLAAISRPSGNGRDYAIGFHRRAKRVMKVIQDSMASGAASSPADV